MEVETKLQLLLFYESYWDMLPPEKQEYIMQLKIAQEEIDAERKEMITRLCHEIQFYARLKEKRGLGHVKCVPNKRACYACGQYHLKVFGFYVDEAGVKRRKFLSNGMIRAFELIDFVKSRL